MKRQIKTKLSRILCVALILCMMLALIPSAFATTAEGTNDFSINFYEFAMAPDNNGKQVNNTSLSYGDVWQFYEKSAGLGAEFSESYQGVAIKSSAEKEYVAFEFNAPATGDYKVEYDYFKYSNGGIGNVYVVSLTEDIDISKVIDGVDGKIFSGVCYNSNKTNDENPVTSKDSVSLTANEKYLVIFVLSEAYDVNGSLKYRMFPTSLTFSYVEPTYSDVKAVYSFSEADYTYLKADPQDEDTPSPDIAITYENSGGRVQFDSLNATGTRAIAWQDGAPYFQLHQKGSYVAFKIRIPKEGTYYLTLDYWMKRNSTSAAMYLFENTGDLETLLSEQEPVIPEVDFGVKHTASDTKETVFEANNPGEYYLVFESINGTENNNVIGSTSYQDLGYVRPISLTLSGSSDLTGVKGYPVASIDAGNAVFEVKDSVQLNFKVNDSATGKPIDDVDVTKLESLNSDVISVNIANNTITAEEPGVATITADVNGYPASVTLTVNDAEMTKAFSDVKADEDYAIIGDKTVQVLKYFTDSKKGEPADEIKVAYNGTASIEIEDIGTPEGYKFLYWAKGATDKRQIIPGETVKVYPMVGVTTYLIAVYEPISGTAENKAEFYNYNGQLLDVTIEGGKMPALPSMTGYGKAEHWAHYGSGVAYGEGALAPEISGTEIFVAQYELLVPDIDVTAVNGTVNGGSSAKVKYGDTVECIATGDRVFKWWTKTDENDNTEIVSLNSEYTFKAWETCTVTAVYGDNAPTYVGDTMRIIIDILDVGGTTDKAVMAEFVGLDRAVEKGIMLGTKRYAMSSKDNQFTIINDDNATDIKGYAILANGTLITDK